MGLRTQGNESGVPLRTQVRKSYDLKVTPENYYNYEDL